MSKKDIDKAFVSPIDKFLFQFDAEHEKSASQKKRLKSINEFFIFVIMQIEIITKKRSGKIFNFIRSASVGWDLGPTSSLEWFNPFA